MGEMSTKLLAAAHLVIARVRPDLLGATKLNKVLWFADCRHYARHGKSITGEKDYVRKPNGPCIGSFDAVVGKLEAENRIHEKYVLVGHHHRREFYSLQEPNVDLLTPAEVDTLLSVAAEISRMTAAEASDLSHDELWEETPPYEVMPIAAGAVNVEPLDIEDLDWARAAFK